MASMLCWQTVSHSGHQHLVPVQLVCMTANDFHVGRFVGLSCTDGACKTRRHTHFPCRSPRRLCQSWHEVLVGGMAR